MIQFSSLLRVFPLLFFLAVATSAVATQTAADCDIVTDEVDPFDSLRTVASGSLPLGNMLITQIETIDGPKLAPEGEAMVMYAQNDSFNLIFLHLELPEYHYVRTEKGFNVKLLMESDSSIIGFYTVPDEGNFSKATNMRHYQHAALVPMNYYYRLTTDVVSLIRVEYANHRRTIQLNAEQQLALREAFRCVGERVKLYPVEP